jgi:hypothetical protein
VFHAFSIFCLFEANNIANCANGKSSVESYGCTWTWDDDTDEMEIVEQTKNTQQGEVGGEGGGQQQRNNRRLANSKVSSLWSSLLFSPRNCCGGGGDVAGTTHHHDDNEQVSIDEW